MENEDDFLDAIHDEDVVEDAATAAPTPPEPAQPEPEVLELTEVATPAPTPAEAPEPVRSDDAADGRLAALLDERDKRKAAEAELARLREASQAQQQPLQMPDPYEDPEGFARAQQSQQAAALYQINLRYSERLAKVEHGAEKVKAAKTWAMAKCDADPHFNAKIAASDDPVGLAVAEYQREEIASKVTPDEFAQFQAWKNAQGQIASQAAPAATPNTASAIPPRSLASAPSAGGILTQPIQSDEEIFAEVIPKR